ncbi:MAG: hypothetical protein KGZ37_05820 [Nitrosarchaeum sp.]|nr:hypothetical protein [Nitrosarchaeum sp.]
MPDDIPSEEIDDIKRIMEGYIGDFTNVDNNISKLVKNSVIKDQQLESYDENTQNLILENRDKALSTGFIAISTMALIIRRFRSAAKLSSLFIQLVNRFVSLITKHVRLFKIESIQFTVSLTPSIVIVFKS